MMNSFSHGGNLATGQVPLRGTVIFVQRDPPVNWWATISCPSGTKPLRTFRPRVLDARTLRRRSGYRPRFVAAMSDAWRRGPGGTTDNSPAFQRRVRATNQPRPVGTPELAVVISIDFPFWECLPHLSANLLASGWSENSNREIRRRSRHPYPR